MEVIGGNRVQAGVGFAGLAAAICAGILASSTALGTQSAHDTRQLGPCTRRCALTFSEIMYHPADYTNGWDTEFVEIYNSDFAPRDISGYRISGEIDYRFPDGTVIGARSNLVVAAAPNDMAAAYPLSNMLGPYSNRLSNGGGTVRLRDEMDAILLEAEYNDNWPWPTQADGAGHSLVLARPDYGEANRLAWLPSAHLGGSPGTADPSVSSPTARVVINEFLAHTDLPQIDFVELHNPTTQAVDMSGCVLTDEPAIHKHVIAPGTTLTGNGFVSLDQNALGFSLSMHGDAIYLIDTNANRVVDAVQFPAQANGVATGRYPDGSPELRVLASPTAGTDNAPLRQGDVVINEIMYHPITADNDDEYIELYNRGAASIDISHWRFIDGIDFTFPTGTVLGAGDYIVVAHDAAHLLINYPHLNATNTLGDYSGQLSDRGEQVVLARPDDPELPLEDFVVVDTVTYGDGTRWGRWADGGGSSLELVDPHSDNRRAMNWAGSDESQKAPWTLVETNAMPALGRNNDNELHVLLFDSGECLVDDVEVYNDGGANRVPNGTFESGLGGWIIQGTHIDSALESGEGHGGDKSLRLRASGRGDNSANRAEIDFSSSVSMSVPITIRAWVRWVAGCPGILLRLHGNWLEASGTMTVPANLGTPGQQNSRYAANVGPAISQVIHTPILPAADEPVVVTARLHDPDGVASAELKYRVDPDPGITTVAMRDDGVGVDVLSGDGIFSAAIPGKEDNKTVAFSVETVDGHGIPRSTRFPEGASDECLVMFGQEDVPGELGTYRLWVTEATRQHWQTRQKLSDHALPGTLVYGGVRVAYEAGGRYRGSPFIRREGNPETLYSSFLIYSSKDDRILDSRAFNLDRLELDNTYQQERMATWMGGRIGLPNFHQRPIHFFINEHLKRDGSKPPVYGDTQQLNRDFVRQWAPGDTKGDLIKIDDWFEFNDSAQVHRQFNVNGRLEVYEEPDGTKSRRRYRWSWWREQGEIHDDDYTSLFTLVDALNVPHTTAYYEAWVRRVVNVEEWMSFFAFQHIIRNWDSYGYNRGKNASMYKPSEGGWELYMWDLDRDHLSGNPNDDNLFRIEDPTLKNAFFVQPRFLRAYWASIYEMAEGPMVAETCDPVMDANYAAYVANGVAVTSPDNGLKSWIATRRNFLLNKLQPFAADFAITSNGGADFSTDDLPVRLTGTAPVGVRSFRVNGMEHPVSFSSVIGWTMDIGLDAGANPLLVEGLDRLGNVVASDAITVTFTGQAATPAGALVINEIMYHPALPDAEFVEIHNLSHTETFDLSGFRLDGIDHTFGSGTFIAPTGFIVVAENAAAYAQIHTNEDSILALSGEFDGTLDNGGETLRLLMPAGTNAWITLDEVRYDDDPPWPAEADGTGSSLQLIDATKDNNRIGNWAVAPAVTAPGWRYIAVTGVTAAGSVDYAELHLYLGSAGAVVVDDVRLVEGTDAANGVNLLSNGNFESPLSGPWAALRNHADSSITNDPVHGGSGSLVIRASGPGLVGRWSETVSQGSLGLSGSTTYAVGLWYHTTDDDNVLKVELTDSSLFAANATRFILETLDGSSPGQPNDVRAPLPAFPQLWVNEIMPSNVSHTADNMGDFDPWVELYNAGTGTVNLGEGYLLSDDAANPAKWAFPSGTAVGDDDRLLVWTDGEPGETVPGFLHAGFRLNSASGCVVLAREHAGQIIVLDAIWYSLIGGDYSYGSFPEGDPSRRQVFHSPTPGYANSPTSQPVLVRVNEWMADNDNTVRDPADNDFDDWFELYNAGTPQANLGGFMLADDLGATNGFTIPGGTVLPGGAYLMVWADEETGQNAPGGDLHVDFKLSRNGESIALFAPDGSLVDAVTFSTQLVDRSEGRWPDGAPQIHVMAPPTPAGANRVLVITALNGQGQQQITITWDSLPGVVYRVDWCDGLNTSPH